MKILTKIKNLFQSLLILLVGKPQWDLPFWLDFIKKQTLTRANTLRKNKPKIFWPGLATLLLLSGGGYYGYQWYKNLPKPEFVQLFFSSPAPTPNNIYTNELKPYPFSVSFDKSVAKLEQISKVVEKGISVTPKVEGEWKWISDKTLYFFPKTDWAPNQTYTVTFDKKFFPSHIKLEKNTFTFDTPIFGGVIKEVKFYQDPVDPKIKKIVATVIFTYPVDAESCEKGILLTPDGKNPVPLSTTVQYSKNRREAYIHSQTLELGDKDVFYTLELGEDIHPFGSSAKLASTLSSRVTVPSIYTFFRVNDISTTIVRNDNNDPEQILIIGTTDGIKTEDLEKSIEVYLLPKDKPGNEDQEAVKDYAWSNYGEVTDEILNLSQKIKIETIPTEKDYEMLHSFKFKQNPKRYLYVRIAGGLRSFGGYTMPNATAEVEMVPLYPKELTIMHTGSLLSLTGEKKLSVQMRGISSVTFELDRIETEEINHLVTQTGDHLFSDPVFTNENYGFNVENISEVFTETKNVVNPDPAVAQYDVVDFAKYLGPKKGLFILKVTEGKVERTEKETDESDEEGEYDEEGDYEEEGEDRNYEEENSYGLSDKRLILVTDLGLIAKDNADKTHDIFVQSFATGLPVADVTIEILGKNGLPVFSTKTNTNGQAKIPDYSTFKFEKKPVVIIAKKGDDFSFLPINTESSRYLSLYKFNTDGKRTYGQTSLEAFVFTDRGIYRPGEKMQSGIIIKSTDWAEKLTNVPLEISITDPRGTLVSKQKISLPQTGFLEINYQTDETSSTGIYYIEVSQIKKEEEAPTLIGSESFRVEEFQPDQMKITSTFSVDKKEGWVSPVNLNAKVHLQNLYGTPASDRTIKSKMTLTQFYPGFSKFKNYFFFDPYKMKEGVTENLADTKTNENGDAEIFLNLNRFTGNSFRIEINTEGLSGEGGRSVKTKSAVLVSPLSFMVGYKPDGETYFIKKEAPRKINLIAIDPDLKNISSPALKTQLVEKKYVSTLVLQNNGTYKFQSVLKEVIISENPITIPEAGLDYNLETKNPGDFELRIFKDDGVKISELKYSVAGEANLSRKLEKTAELSLNLDKKTYKAGEEIEVSIKAPYEGAGLITIERDHVLASTWFTTKTNSTVAKIKIPENLDGNAYVNVVFLRAKTSTEIYASPLSYAATPFQVDLEKRTNVISLETPKLAKPGENFTIKYKASSPTPVVIYAVDEGILQFAGYPTPDPLSFFFEKRALEVDTAQTLDLILPEYSLYKNFATTGGDTGYKYIGNNLNPFRRKTLPPMVYWSGIIDADTTEKEISFPIPDHFNGSLRVMAVSVSDEKIGVAKTDATIRGPFVITPTAPLFATPDDQFTVGVTLANNVENSGENPMIDLKLETTDNLEIVGDAFKTLTIGEKKEQSTIFVVKAKNKLGNADLVFKAIYKDHTSKSTISLSIRPATPYMTTLTSGVIKPQGSETISLKRKLKPEFGKGVVSASVTPLAFASGLLSYLEEYPYGCTEQLTSKGFPILALKNNPEFGYTADKTNAYLASIIRQLRSRQNSIGFFSYWPGQNLSITDNGGFVFTDLETVHFTSMYAIHFLIEAKEKGVAVPQDMLTRAQNYLTQFLGASINSEHQAYLYAYSTYLLTRTGVVTSNYLGNLLNWYESDDDEAWKKTINGTFVASIYSMLKNKTEAEKIVGQFEFMEADNRWDYFFDTQATSSSLHVYLLSKHFPDRIKNLKVEDIEKITAPIISNSYNTYLASLSILALDAYAQAISKEESSITIDEIQKDKKETLSLIGSLVKKSGFSILAEKIGFTTTTKFPLYYQITQSGFDESLPKEEIKEGLEVQREYRNEKNEVVTKAKLGETLYVYLKVRGIDKSVADLVVVDLLPGGFELVDNPYIHDGKSAKTVTSPMEIDYVDTREDRVVLFGYTDTNAREFVYSIKATNKGTFVIPPSYAGSMYDLSIKARALAGSIVVE